MASDWYEQYNVLIPSTMKGRERKRQRTLCCRRSVNQKRPVMKSRLRQSIVGEQATKGIATKIIAGIRFFSVSSHG